MQEKNEVAGKIDSFLKSKKAKSTESKSFIPLKKLMNCDWDKEEHLRDVALECIAEMLHGDDEMAEEFRKQMFKQTKSIAEGVIKMYMASNDLDILPPRS